MNIFQVKESFMYFMLSYIAHIEICSYELNSSFIHDRSTPDVEPLSLPMSTDPEDFINNEMSQKPFRRSNRNRPQVMTASQTYHSNKQIRSYRQSLHTCFSCPQPQTYFPIPGVLQELHLCQNKYLRQPIQKCVQLRATW